MAHFYFSIRVRDRLLPDREGVDLAQGVDVRACAVHLAERLKDDPAISRIQLEGCAIEVTDAAGAYLLSVPVALEGRGAA